MLCAYLAGALLVGLLGNALLGAWWLDPAFLALLIAVVAVKEGSEAWRGEGCCVRHEHHKGKKHHHRAKKHQRKGKVHP